MKTTNERFQLKWLNTLYLNIEIFRIKIDSKLIIDTIVRTRLHFILNLSPPSHLILWTMVLLRGDFCKTQRLPCRNRPLCKTTHSCYKNNGFYIQTSCSCMWSTPECFLVLDLYSSKRVLRSRLLMPIRGSLEKATLA